MNPKAFFAAAALLLLGAGCAATNDTTSAPVPARDTGAAAPEATYDDPRNPAAVLAGSRIVLDGRNSLKPGAIDFRFKLYGLDGHEFGPSDLKASREKKMHLFLVRDDMTGFQHLHPEYQDGKWSASASVAQAGDYQLYVDIDPAEETPVVLRVPVTIGGKTAAKTPPVPDAGMAAEAQGVKAALETSGVRTREDVRLAFSLAKGGRPATDLKPYLGAYGHVVAIRHDDPDGFYRAYPSTASEPADGKVDFKAAFPTKGRYTLYAQFDVAGSVKTFPITIDVTEEGRANASESRP